MLPNWGFLLTLSMVCRIYGRKVFKEPWRPDAGSDYLKFAASGIARVAIRSVNYGFSADVKNPPSAQSTASAISQTNIPSNQPSSVPSAHKFQQPNSILPPGHPQYHRTGTAITTLVTSQGQSNYPHLNQGTHLPAATATNAQATQVSQYFPQPTAANAAQGFNQFSHQKVLQQQSSPLQTATIVYNSHQSGPTVQPITDTSRHPSANFALTGSNTQIPMNAHPTNQLKPVLIGNQLYSPNSYVFSNLNNRPADGSHTSVVPPAVAINQNFPSQITTVPDGYNRQNIYPVRWSQPFTGS